MHPVTAAGSGTICVLAMAACGDAPRQTLRATSGTGAGAVSELHAPRTSRALVRLARVFSYDGQQWTDRWHDAHGRFVFDLNESNPSAVALEKASPARYVEEAGCRH